MADLIPHVVQTEPPSASGWSLSPNDAIVDAESLIRARLAGSPTTEAIPADQPRDAARPARSAGPSVSADALAFRPDSKRRLWQSERLLLNWAEPFAAWLLALGGPDLRPGLRHAWQRLLAAMAPPRAAGLVSDAVARETLALLEQAYAHARHAVSDALFHLAAHGPGGPGDLLIFNPAPWPRHEPVTAIIELPRELSHFRLLEADGKPIAYQLNPLGLDAPELLDPAGGAASRLTRRVRCSFTPGPIPALGYRTVKVLEGGPAPFFVSESIAAGNTLENGLLRVTAKANGALRIEDKRTGRIFENCNVFEDAGDAGDAGRFRRPEFDGPGHRQSTHAAVSIAENGWQLGVLEIAHQIDVPLGLTPDRRRRVELQVPLRVTSRVALRRDRAAVEISTRVENLAEGHRLQALFSTPFATTSACVGRREAIIHVPLNRKGIPTALPPVQGFVDLSDGQAGLAVATRGIYAAEVKTETGAQLALTLLRSATTCDLPDGRTLAVPDGAALGRHEFDYTILPHAGDWRQVWRPAYEAVTDFAYQQVGLHALLSAPTSRQSATRLPAPVAGLLLVVPQSVRLLALKPAERDRGIVARLVNLSDEDTIATLTFGVGVRAAWTCALDEQQQDALPVRDNAVALPIAAHREASVWIEPLAALP